MTEQQVPDKMTHATPTEVYAALRAAWRLILATEPARSSLLVLLAHWSFETGNGGGMHNWNIGNIQHVPGDGRDFCVFKAGEIINGRSWTGDEAFRAYGTLEDGVTDYMHTLRSTFGFAWPAVESGDVEDFSHRLRQRHYYTADEAVYTRGIKTRYEMLDAAIPPDTVPDAAQYAQAAVLQAGLELDDGGHDTEPPPEPDDA